MEIAVNVTSASNSKKRIYLLLGFGLAFIAAGISFHFAARAIPKRRIEPPKRVVEKEDITIRKESISEPDFDNH